MIRKYVAYFIWSPRAYPAFHMIERVGQWLGITNSQLGDRIADPPPGVRALSLTWAPLTSNYTTDNYSLSLTRALQQWKSVRPAERSPPEINQDRYGDSLELVWYVQHCWMTCSAIFTYLIERKDFLFLFLDLFYTVNYVVSFFV